MNRRSIFKLAALFTGSQAIVSLAAPTQSSLPRSPIVLYCDLAVDPAREQEMLNLRKVVQGVPPPPSGINYRFQLTYESEEKRQLWIHSKVHQTVWPMVETTVAVKGYLVLLT